MIMIKNMTTIFSNSAITVIIMSVCSSRPPSTAEDSKRHAYHHDLICDEHEDHENSRLVAMQQGQQHQVPELARFKVPEANAKIPQMTTGIALSKAKY